MVSKNQRFSRENRVGGSGYLGNGGIGGGGRRLREAAAVGNGGGGARVCGGGASAFKGPAGATCPGRTRPVRSVHFFK